MRKNKTSILLVSNVASEEIGTIKEHVDALRGLNGYVRRIDYRTASYINLEVFDVVILHYSLVLARGGYISEPFAKSLKKYRGLTICFIQDEYRWVDETANMFRELNVNVVFSLIRESVVRKVYHHPWCDDIRFEYTLTGFVNDELVTRNVPDYKDRKVDVGYRARKLLAWYGYHAQQKWEIAESFICDARSFPLTLDISTREEDRIYGDNWIEFVANCKAVLGTESGASVCDYSGDIQRNVEAHLQVSPDATYEQLRDLYFKENDGKVVMNVISPRCFEAAALRTLMIMYPGEYGGILEPWKHYVPLERDHSNFAEVITILKSPERAQEIIKTAYQDIACSGKWSLKSLQEHVEHVIDAEMNKRSRSASLGKRRLERELSVYGPLKVNWAIASAKIRQAEIVKRAILTILTIAQPALRRAEHFAAVSANAVITSLLPESKSKIVKARIREKYGEVRRVLVRILTARLN